MSIEFTARVSAALLLALAAACSKHNANLDTSSAAGTIAPDTTTATAAPTPLPSGVVLTVVSRAGAGPFLADGNGRALYVVDRAPRDTNSWRPVAGTVPATNTDTAIKAGLIGTTNSRSGPQATYSGKALFYYAGDQTSADLNGDGKNASGTTGHLIAPDGSSKTGRHTGIKP